MSFEKKNYLFFYNRLTSGLRKGCIPALLNALNALLTGVMYVAYPVLLVILWRRQPEQLLRAILIPGVGFVLLSLVRLFINRPRPYETWDIQPLITREKPGNSMPSRHVFSTVIIAMAFYYYFPPAGVIFLLVGLLSSLVRVLGGMHYPTDVFAGYLLGLLGGLCFFL